MNVLTRTLCSYWSSSIGKKTIVALTGIILLLFLPGHLIGNLLVFLGPDAINEYGVFLHEAGHGALVWVARISLLTCFVVHIVATVQLTKMNKAARQDYAFKATVQATRSSRLMIWSGFTILFFVVYHILHFTARVGNDYSGSAYQTLVDGHPAQNVYKMMIDGFSWAPATIVYIIAITCLCSHLSHGVSSIFQTLGFRTKKSSDAIKVFGNIYAFLIWVGFLSIPIAIFFFGYGS